MSHRFSRRGGAAFSLVEIALTLGVMAFALVAILGLMSVGINASRDSGDDTKVAFIMQDVAARLRAEVSGVNLTTDPTKMDLAWNTAYGSALNYTILGNTALGTDSSGQPQAAATAYYTLSGQFVKQAGATAPTANFYKAAILVQPLTPSTPYPFPTPNLSSAGNYPFLAVTIKVGWPTDNQVNGNVLGPGANVSKSTATFYLLKP